MAAHLPSDSAVARADGDGWSEAERLIAAAADACAVVWWQRTDRSLPGNAEPPRVMSPRERERAAEGRTEYTSDEMDEIAELLGIPEDRR